MSKLLDCYKEYKKLLVQQDTFLNKLVGLETLNKDFLNFAKSTYDNNKTAELKLLGLSAKLGGQQEELKKANGDPKKSEELNVKIKNTKENIALFEKQKKDTAALLPWKDAPKLTSAYLKHYQANLEHFQQYMECYKSYSDSCLKLIDMQQSIMGELTDCDPKEREKGIAWSKENITSLKGNVLEKQNQVSSKFASDLHEAYYSTCMAHANFLGKHALAEKVDANKISLFELEELVAHRKEKQNIYRALLPNYVVAELEPNAHIQGQRTFGLTATNTESKVKAITTYLQTSLSEDEAGSQRKIKELFAKININLNDGQISRIYNAAKEKSQQLDAEHSSQARLS